MIAHADTPVIKAYIQTKFLHNMDESIKGATECRIFGVGSYPGHALTFDIWLPENGAVFDYAPIHLLTTKPDAVLMDMRNLLVRDCPDETISVTVFSFLKEKPVNVELRLENDTKVWIPGKYLFSVDWYNKNELFNVVALESGQICAQPHYRMLFGNVAPKLPPYKKLKSEWKVNT